MVESVALVLEGGGMRGCYTAGAMKWLYEHGYMFKYTVSISATAIHSLYYAAGMIQEMHDISVNSVTDPKFVGIQAILSEGAIVAYNYMCDKYIRPTYKKALEKVRDSDMDFEIGMYNMTQQQLQYKNQYELDDNADILKASCTLPISGRMTEVDGEKYLDGGIDTMVSTARAKAKGYKKMLVIVTKDKNYVRKPNGFWLTLRLKILYGKYKEMLKTLDHRTAAYYEQMDSVYELEDEGNAILIRPSRDCGVKRFSGDAEQLEELFQLGWQDMEDRKDDIIKFLSE
ncbi:MAG: patatin family protein [Erysipelotrichaceae bacterium]|nr:patatin family protein [Erysipelotrichaceae bacterium]